MLRKMPLFLNLLLFVALSGCGSQTTADKADAKRKVAAIAADAPVSAAGATQSTADSPVSVPSTNPVSAHPIDQVAEGKSFRIASRALDKGDFETALRIQNELKLSPQYSVLATALEALTLVKQGKLDEALRLAEEVSAVPVMQCEAYVIAGEVFQRENRLTEAIAAFENAVQINPQHVRAHLWLGSIYYDTGAMSLATVQLRRAAELEPTEVKSLLLSGKIFQDYEQYPDAVKDFRIVLDRADSDEMKIAVRVKLAECLYELRQLDEATRILRDCEETASVLAVKASIAEAAGDSSGAATFARLALQQSPKNRTASLVLGRILVAERKWDEAVTFLKDLVEVFPYDHESKLIYGRALVGSGEKEAGKIAIAEATDLKNLFLQFADLHQEATKHPEDAAIRVTLGQLAEKLGKIDLARTWYKAAQGLDPQNSEANDSMNRLK